MKEILFVGPFCPPITGQTLMTDFIWKKIVEENLGKVTKINIVRGNTNNKLINILIRTIRIGRCIITILKKRTCSDKTLYLSVDANIGMYATVFIAFLGTTLKYKILLHHHSYSHLVESNIKMVLLAKLAGPTATHVNICSFMSKRMLKLYPDVKYTLNLSNAIALSQQPLPNTPVSHQTSTPFTMGFLGKVSEEKGVYVAVQVFERLSASGENVRLTIAGPAADTRIDLLLKRLKSKYGQDKFRYLGPVYGPEKEHFYQSLDVFMFPTLYINETQGIVNIEAMSYGVPVIAFGRCCVASDVGTDGGLVVPVVGDYVNSAVDYIKAMINSSELHHRRKVAAHRQFQTIKELSKQEYLTFVSGF